MDFNLLADPLYTCGTDACCTESLFSIDRIASEAFFPEDSLDVIGPS